MASVFKRYGEERYARRLARAIIARRQERPFTRTADLAEVVKAAHPAWEKGKHPATRVFQAMRIEVNGELDQLTLERQQDILTRLLKAENAERVRGEKEERESRTARETPTELPPSLEEYQRKKAQEIELLRTVPADLTPYYKLRVNDYFNTLEVPNRE